MLQPFGDVYVDINKGNASLRLLMARAFQPLAALDAGVLGLSELEAFPRRQFLLSTRAAGNLKGENTFFSVRAVTQYDRASRPGQPIIFEKNQLSPAHRLPDEPVQLARHFHSHLHRHLAVL